jgi:transposase-like protein
VTVMTVPTRSFTLEEKREHVLAYLESEHGSKTAYLEEHSITHHQIHSWRYALADGDLGVGLVPRNTGSMSKRDVAEVRRLQAEVARLSAERDAAVADRNRMAKAADALGKAIDVMQQHGVGSDEDAQH